MPVRLNEAAQKREKEERRRKRAAVAQRLGLSREEDVKAVSPNGDVLVAGERGWQLWRGRHAVAFLAPTVRGYTWKPMVLPFFRLNARDEIIGNGQIATAYATSGGTSSPHGRWMALRWQSQGGPAEDLNGLIDPAGGWYLDQTVDINSRGQILCVGRRTDARGAEDFDWHDVRLLVLTPLR